MIEDHRHCRVCGKAVPIEENFCSERCKERWTKIARRRRLLVYALYALIAIFIIAILVIR